MAVIAYARVSTEGQTLKAQLAQLKAGTEKIFREKVSGARPPVPRSRRPWPGSWEPPSCHVQRVLERAQTSVWSCYTNLKPAHGEPG